jgi:hypothetical protein
MRIYSGALFVLALVSAACTSRVVANEPLPLSADRAAAIVSDVRAFAKTVAHDVTHDGPAAWRKHFSESPAFFMAAAGSLVFADSKGATLGIEGLAHTIQHIDLKWGDDLRVDPLAQGLAVMATPWHEIRVDTAGARVDESGYFTATVEYRGGRWQFRNAHWSVTSPPAAVQ